MAENDFGIIELVEEDHAYRGSRFAEVRDAIFANPYQSLWGAPGEPPMPDYKTSLADVLRGVWTFGRRYWYARAAERTVDSHADLRWGPDRKGFRRLIHANGVCLTGQWEITEDTGFSGYFKRGSRGLIVGRCSSRLPRRGQYTRSIALAGKLYPTVDPDHAEPLRPASFITQEDLGGAYSRYINDADMRNAPDVTPWRQGLGAPVLAISGVVFNLVDKDASQRQLHQIAELGKPPTEPTRAPAFMRLRVAPDQPRIEGEELDFRDEVMAQIYDRGDPTPKRTLVYEIELADRGAKRSILGYTRWSIEGWRRAGRITFDRAAASYNGDHVIHFNHPGWRDDRNDPASAFRPPLQP